MTTRQLFEEPAAGRRRPVVVLGGPGSGKTGLVVDLACHWASQPGVTVLALTSNRVAAGRLRTEVHGRLLRASPTRVLAAPLVRTTHSYAFALLEAQARARGNPPPRLVPAVEQDAVLRELAMGEGSRRWPEPLRGALGSSEFTAQLRTVFQRAAQHGLGPEGLMALGRERSRPEWVAAGRTWQEYEQVMMLRGAVGMADPGGSAPAVDAAELLAAALDAVAEDPELVTQPASAADSLAVFVDDAQHFDPQAARLAGLLVKRADLGVVTADPDQSVFWFQGAQGPSFWRQYKDVVQLGPSRRFTQAVAGLVDQVAPRQAREAGAVRAGGSAQVRRYPTVATQAEGIVEALCRAHTRDGVPWSRMAVLERSTSVFAPSLARAAALASMPLRTEGAEEALSANPAIRALLTLLKAACRGRDRLEPDEVLELLVSPLAGAVTAEVRALRRQLKQEAAADLALRSSRELLTDLVHGDHPAPDSVLPQSPAGSAVLRLRAVWQAVAEVRGQTVEEVLWAAWSASELEERWGPDAAAAADFAAVNALFDLARESSLLTGSAGLTGLVERVERERLPPQTRSPQARGDAVTLVSAHAAAGREWDVVVVCGVQEGLWPSLREPGSLLGVGDLTEALAGTEAGAEIDTRKLVLEQERRLFYLACSRARDQLLITAVDSGGSEGEYTPSRFLARLTSSAEGRETSTTRWSALGVVADLRTLACGADPDRAQRAAEMLAALSRARVAGAHPSSWHGLAGVSTSDPLFSDRVVTLSPSRVEQLLVCPLRWLFEQVARDSGGAAAQVGTAVHLLAASASRFSAQELRSALAAAIRRADEASRAPEWAAERQRARLALLLETFLTWHALSREELVEVGVEIPVQYDLPGEPEVRLKGRIDRIERRVDGGLVVVDLKTARTPRSAAAVESDAQLACYQLMADGVVDEGRLVFLGAPRKETGAAERRQAGLTDQSQAEWELAIRAAGTAASGPEFQARPNPGCGSCPGRRCCPAQSATIKPLPDSRGGGNDG